MLSMQVDFLAWIAQIEVQRGGTIYDQWLWSLVRDDIPNELGIAANATVRQANHHKWHMVASGKHTKSYWKWSFIVDLPINFP